MLYTHAPSTWPTGSKPTPRIAANSSVESADPQVPLPRISAIRARAADGSPAPVLSSVNARPFRLLLNAAPRLPFPAGSKAPGRRAGRIPAQTRHRHLQAAGRAARSVLGVPLLVAAADGLQGPGRLLLGGVGPEPVLARAVTVPLRPVMPEAIPPAPFIVHATRLPDHGNDAPARPDLTHPAGAGAHPPAGIRRQEAPVDG